MSHPSGKNIVTSNATEILGSDEWGAFRTNQSHLPILQHHHLINIACLKAGSSLPRNILTTSASGVKHQDSLGLSIRLHQGEVCSIFASNANI